MSKVKTIKTALVTGSAGFIGYHVSQRLLSKRLESCWHRLYVGLLRCFFKATPRRYAAFQSDKYISIHSKIEDPETVHEIFEQQRPDLVVHLAAQAGVRYSIVNPRTYLESNIIGTFEILEAARSYPPKHMLFASTSSAYGANKKMPYREIDPSDHQMSFYAATKKSTESMAHSYSHLFDIPITMFRFTVYGPGGRPDMALFKFTKAILCDQPIDVYNNGNMRRDFTFISDLINAIELLVTAIPTNKASEITKYSKIDSKSSIAPFRVINIGNSCSVPLMEFIEAIEDALSKKATKNFLPIQAGDVPETLADTSLLSEITGYKPTTNVKDGVKHLLIGIGNITKCKGTVYTVWCL